MGHTLKTIPWFSRRGALLLSTIWVLAPAAALALDRAALELDAHNALQKLSSTVPAAQALSKVAAAVLVFPKIGPTPISPRRLIHGQ